MPNYNDLYLRQSLQDTTPVHYGGCASPDIIPWGTEEAADPDLFQKDYDKNPGKNLVPGAPNYLYVRCKNPDTAKNILGQMYLARASPCLLLWPDSLTTIDTVSGKEYYELKVPADSIGVNLSTYTYTPAAGEYLGAFIETQSHPVVPLPTLHSVWKLADYLRDTPAFAQRSQHLDPDGTGVYAFTGSYEQRSEPARMMFSIECRNCPVDWVVSVLPTKGGPIKIQKTTVQNPDITFSSDAELPEGYADTFTFEIDRKTTKPNPGTRVRLMVYLIDERDAIYTRIKEDISEQVFRRIPLSGHEFSA